MGKLPWIKLYAEIIHDPKIRRLTVDERWFWIVLLCLASQNEERGQVSLVTNVTPFNVTDFVELCGYSFYDENDPNQIIKNALEKFKSMQMLEMDEKGFIFLNNFIKRQDRHLSNAERASRYRSKHKVTNVTLDIEEEKIKIKKKNNSPLPPKRGKNGLVGFDKFWDSYPKKLSKAQAERAWVAINPNEQLQTAILAAVERAKTSEQWGKDGGQFIPYPATWLRARGWEDVYDVQLGQQETWAERRKREAQSAVGRV